MVYCTKCGTKNEEDARVCVKCGASLVTEIGISRRYKRRPKEEECFGIPGGGAIVGLIFGIIIIIAGVSFFLNQVYGWEIEFWNFLWPFVVIIFGILVLVGAYYGFRRRS